MNNVIITQNKNNSWRLKDWILYHNNQGFDTFIIFDDYSEDNFEIILNNIKEKYNINILFFKTDKIGYRSYSLEECNNSESYGHDIMLHRRICRSYTNGNNIVKKINPNAICAFIDIDEFLVSNNENKIVDTIKNIINEKNIEQLLVYSFDTDDSFEMKENYLFDIKTCYRWSYDGFEKDKIFRNRCKSIIISKFLDNVQELPGRVHSLRNLTENDAIRLGIRSYSDLRIHHLRKPTLPTKIEFEYDDTLKNKYKNILENTNEI